MNTKILKCKSCNGTMEIDEERPILFCPYCGSKELIEESDDVTKARIEADTKLKENKMKLQHRKEIKEMQQKNDRKNEILTITEVLIFLLLFFGFVLFICLFYNK